MSMSDSMRHRIDELVEDAPVVVFMKGHRFAPQCGFSATVVEILDGYLDDYQTVDVLADAEMRDAIKDYSSWPTIPQIYVDGEFIGGCDILREMHGSGDLRRTLGDKVVEVKAPTLRVTPVAAAAIRSAVEKDDGDVYLRLRVDPRFYNELSVEEAADASDFQVKSEGITVLVDPASARRSDGVTIDYVENDQEAGFRVDNPKAPATVRQISVGELKALLAEQSDNIRLIDVRSTDERNICAIEGSELYTPDLAEELNGLDRSTPLVFVCHHGGRSQHLAEQFVAKGFTDVINVMGGIDAWASQIEPSMRRY